MTNEETEESNENNNAKDEPFASTTGWIRETVHTWREVQNESGEIDTSSLPGEIRLNKSWNINDVPVFVAEVHLGGIGEGLGGMGEELMAWAGVVRIVRHPGLPELEAGGVWNSDLTAREFCESMIESWLDEFPYLGDMINKVTHARSEEE